MSSIDEIEERRAQRKANLDEDRKVQLAVDLEALDALEIQHGDSNVARLNLPYSPGLPTFCVVRTPNQHETKRYRFMCADKTIADESDRLQRAAEALTAVTLVYPDKDVFERVKAARPGVASQLAFVAVKLATGREDAEGKG